MMQGASVHEFQLGDTVQRQNDGDVGLVVEARALYASVLWQGPFPEVTEVEQFDSGIRVKERAREAVENFAEDLLELGEVGEEGELQPPVVAEPPSRGRLARGVCGLKVPGEDDFRDVFEDACTARVQAQIDNILYSVITP